MSHQLAELYLRLTSSQKNVNLNGKQSKKLMKGMASLQRLSKSPNIDLHFNTASFQTSTEKKITISKRMYSSFHVHYLFNTGLIKYTNTITGHVSILHDSARHP